MASLTIPVILGTSREGRRSLHAANFVIARVRSAGHHTELIDTRDFPQAATDNSESNDMAKAYAAKIVAADALIIVSPEYNHGYPGELKMMLDMTYKPYEGLPLGLCGVSHGPWGGVRMIEQLRGVAGALGMFSLKQTVMFRNVTTLFDDQGVITDEERYTKSVDGLIAQLAKYATALRTNR